ncbi:GRIP1-associated protein 1-like isoform X2 [Clavelina lepadiformis]|uniref:GRIP1-associated protein 1-like isoform X2 n=1 Tax=Clavelina lepadiformis TaxID=159417 RepID=UPI004042A777
MAQSLSDEEFHRMQLQLIEMRTENYKLKDENKKQALKLKDLAEKEVRLDKELNKQTKMKRALSTLNKSKQAQEYEALLQQQEEQFALQNQTLMEELSRLSLSVDKLEKENDRLKRQEGESADMSNDSELRRLQAQNTALKTSMENMQRKHKEELQERLDSFRPTTQQTNAETKYSAPNGQDPSIHFQDPLSVDADHKDINKEHQNSVEQEDEPGTSNSLNENSSNTDKTTMIEQQLLHTQAQYERLKQQLATLQDVEVQYEAERVEKKMLEKTLEEERNRHMKEQRALTNEVESCQEKVDRKQALLLQIQDEKEKLFLECQSLTSKLGQQRDEMTQESKEENQKLHNEMSSLRNALQNAQHLLEKQQVSMETIQKQAQSHESDKLSLQEDIQRLKSQIVETEQKMQAQQNQHSENSTKTKMLEGDIISLKSRLERATMERDDAVTKFEENARASGALLQRVDSVEQSNDAIRRELAEAKELAEKRKKVMDKQAMDSQENNAKFTKRIAEMQSEYNATLKHTNNSYEEKIKALEHTCKRQEQELIRMNMQDRTKARELDTIQQQMRDIQATASSLENSKGWFERALQDAEKLAEDKQIAHKKQIEDIKQDQKKDLDKVRLEMLSKDEEVSTANDRIQEAKSETAKRDELIKRLEQDIQDEVSKQRLVEKKGQATLKDLKRQLINERKRNEKLQEKLGEISSSKSNLDELLEVVDGRDTNTTGGDGSSVSSFSFRDLISSNKHSVADSNSQASTSNLSSTPTASVSKAESRDLLSRVTALQQDKWQLEEQVRHLEESAGAMANELLEKTKLLQDYIQHTRTDVQRARSSNEELGSRTFGNRMKSIITGQEENDYANIRELNRKLTRMLEEEMTKNMALKQNLAALSNQLAEKR